MKKGLTIFLLMILSLVIRAQTPPTCFEIESVLVDACADGSDCPSQEGQNEMVRFTVGPNDLDAGDLSVDWPNGGNPWLGLCQNAGTAAKVTALNETIQSCGRLIEPENELLPAGSSVLLVTSTAMCVAGNSFAGLTDTLIIIFQCDGNTLGHFANFGTNGNTLRTLEMDFGFGCDDEVTYDKADLIDINGNSASGDGASVDFTWGGDASYYNNGCTAPVEQTIFEAGSDVVMCDFEDIALEADVDGSYGVVTWSGGMGFFSDVNALNTTYTPSVNDEDEFEITLSAEGCDGTVTDEVTVYNLTNALTGITTDGGTAICAGQTLVLAAEGTGLFEWSTSVTGPSIEVEEEGMYSVIVDNECGISSESITITVEALPTVDILNPLSEEVCLGEEVLVNAAGSGGAIEWSNTDTGFQTETGDEGWLYASVTNDCATVLDSVEVIVNPLPSVQISPEGPVSLCEGAELELVASGEGTFFWSTNVGGDIINVAEAGMYSVEASNGCGTAADVLEVTFGGNLPVAEITADHDLLICPGESVQLIGSGGDSYMWNGVPSSAIIDANAVGEYTLEASNSCGSSETSVFILMDEMPDVNLLNGPDFAICNGEEARVEVNGTGFFTWSDGAVANAQVFDQTGNYFVTSTAECGTDTAFFTVTEESIFPQLFADPLLGPAPLEVEFSNETPNAETVFWVFEPDMTGYGDEVVYTFTNEGDIEVIMEVTSQLGCVARTTVMIGVGACPFVLYIPTAFTPDNDGFNDVLRVEGNCIESFEWHIYDRWGAEVFVSTDPSENWTGAGISGYAALGEYPYWLKVSDSNGEVHRFEGSITLLR